MRVPQIAIKMSLKTITTAEEMRLWCAAQIKKDRSVALVPTMGALHVGHLTLVKRAASEADVVVVSIFVNPTQFGPSEDFSAYPRILREDVALLGEQGFTTLVFAPSVKEMYPLGVNRTWVEVDKMGDHLCGAARPGHFRGVTTVVSRLFTIVRPDVAVFGLKDAQQFFILKRMTLEFGFDVELIGVPTVREKDGLAKSSRNRYLSKEQRKQARVLSAAVAVAREMIETKGEKDVRMVEEGMNVELSRASLGRIDYACVVDTADLQPVTRLQSGSTIVAAVAVFFDGARLIDNSIVDVP